jgi:hypothetical protein
MAHRPATSSASFQPGVLRQSGHHACRWLLPAALVLGGIVGPAPSAFATDCVAPPRSLTINGGTSRNRTTINASADGGVAASDASGGDDNLAIGILGEAAAGNGGTARSRANGGVIDLDDINSGNNTGNVIRVRSTTASACPGGRAPAIAGGTAPRTSSRVSINGGTSSNTTSLNLSADGGTALSDASGGDNNLVLAILGGASASNGGTASSQANGGAIAIGDINSGNNTGNVIRVGNLSGNVQISGGASTNSTSISLSADGGTALSDASGGDGNVAVGLGALGNLTGNASAGNGGTADSSANGGAISIGDINSGGNTGNVIQTGNLSGNASIDGGTSTNTTTINASANGGVAVSDASGGDNNVAVELTGVEGQAADAAGADQAAPQQPQRTPEQEAELERQRREEAGELGPALTEPFVLEAQEAAPAPAEAVPAEAIPAEQAVPVDETINAAAGNGGTAETSASGGAISAGDVESGDNTGNVIEVDQ